MPSEHKRTEDRGWAAESVRVTMRNYFSTYHLYAARYSAEAAQEREKSLTGRQPVFDVRHRGLVLGAVTESVAFLEATINEVFQDAADGHQSYVGGLGEACLGLMAALWSATEQGRLEILDKYDLALQFAGQQAFDRGSAPYQDARIVIRLRNYFLHYKPHDVAVDTDHSIGAALKGKFLPNLLMVDSGNPWFPDQALGAGCAEWAWRSTRALSDAFASRIGLRLNYQQADFGDPLPG
jgi:hypothetical protein